MRRVEEFAAAAALTAMVLLPLGELAARAAFGRGIPGSLSLVQHLTLWAAFVGAGLAAADGKLLALATGQWIPEGLVRRAASVFSAGVAAAIAALLAGAGIELVRVEADSGTLVGGLFPAWIAQLILPAALALIALRLAWRASEYWPGRILAGLGIVAGVALGQSHAWFEGAPMWPLLALLVAATVLGAPIFAALGGFAALLFIRDGVPPVAVLAESYRLSVSPTLAAIPLFTLAGFLLAEGHAASRLLRVFRALVGWMPGGTAVVCAAICAFFTAPTGGSGVTILALGGLLYQALREDRYGERFSLGLLTGSGSLGLLLPPALPLILYGIVAQIPIEDLFAGGVLPGILLVGLVAAWGVREGVVSRIPRRPFVLGEAGSAVWAAKWELALPAVGVAAIFSGYATLIEAAAVVAGYTLLVQTLVHRDVTSFDRLLHVVRECAVLIGGVLLILAVAQGLTSWMVDAEIPARALAWVQQHIDSRFAFLLLLNAFLLVVGCLMDIYSATVVVVPLIVPLGAAFGVDPVHLGIIFVANLELGYLTPPVGLNLFLASYRFERPLLEIARAALPMLLILAFGVLLITYVEPMTTWLPSILRR